MKIVLRKAENYMMHGSTIMNRKYFDIIAIDENFILSFSPSNSLPNNLKNIIYQTVSRFGTVQDWNELYEKALGLPEYSERLRILNGLANTRAVDRLEL